MLRLIAIYKPKGLPMKKETKELHDMVGKSMTNMLERLDNINLVKIVSFFKRKS